jgi:Cu/Ag efflux pump CusA
MLETHGLADARIDLQAKEPTVEVTVDLEAAQRVGIKPGDVRRAAAALLSGIEVGSLFEDQKVFEVVVWGAPDTRANLTDVRNLLIDAPNGTSVRLGDVATLEVAPNPTVVRHENVSRSVDVGATVVDSDVTEVVEELENRIGQIAFPLEHHAEVLGSHEEREASHRLLAAVAAVVALGMLLILHAAVGSWRLALAVFLSVPVALLGGVVAVAVEGGGLSIGSLVGFFAVLAVAVRLGIAIVHRAQELDRGPEGPDCATRVRESAGERLAPALVSLGAAAVAMLPLALLRAVPGSEIVHPLAVVVLGGLATAAVAALFVVPALAAPLASGPGWLSGDGGRAAGLETEDAGTAEAPTTATTIQVEALDGKT